MVCSPAVTNVGTTSLHQIYIAALGDLFLAFLQELPESNSEQKLASFTYIGFHKENFANRKLMFEPIKFYGLCAM